MLKVKTKESLKAKLSKVDDLLTSITSTLEKERNAINMEGRYGEFMRLYTLHENIVRFRTGLVNCYDDLMKVPTK